MTDTPARSARKLLRAARMATLATAAQGHPYASLVTPATAPDLSLLLLLSDLAEHTRHLRVDPRCAVLAVGPTKDGNPQTLPRVTITGIAEPIDEPALKRRYLAVHPYAALYAEFADFHLWRIRPASAQFVGGFARAARLGPADLIPDHAAVAAIADAEHSIITHCNHDHPDALARIAGESGQWRMVAVDVDGCDLACADRVIRIHWSGPAATPAEIRRELVAQS